jgi:hypothetical protein
MQGRYIAHQALKAYGGRERISMVCSLRPKSALVKDESNLSGVRPISHPPTLHAQWMQYRLENLEEKSREAVRQWRKRKDAGLEPDFDGVRSALLEQRKFIELTIRELDGGDGVEPWKD